MKDKLQGKVHIAFYTLSYSISKLKFSLRFPFIFHKTVLTLLFHQKRKFAFSFVQECGETKKRRMDDGTPTRNGKEFW